MLTYTVVGRFGSPGERESYALTGSVDFEAEYAYAKPENIARLPEEVLRATYLSEEIAAVVKRRSLTADEARQNGVPGGSLAVVEYDLEQARRVFTRPVRMKLVKSSGSPFHSTLEGRAHRHLEEAGLVWIKDLLFRTGNLFFGTIRITAVNRLESDTCEIEAQTPIGGMSYRLEKGRGLTRLVIESADGTRMTLEECPKPQKNE